MAKTKTPFFGLGSQGTVGQVLTSQKRGAVTLLRKKPLPTDPLSLAQQYQRWLYQDYVYLWNKPGYLDRDKYRSLGVPFHLTAFQYWMKYALTYLPDIIGYWHLDKISGSLTPDASRNGNDMTVIGATQVPGPIDNALDFDGINNELRLASNPTLDTPEMSIECLINPRRFTARDNIVGKGQPFWGNWSWMLKTENAFPSFAITDTGAEVIGAEAKSPTAINLNEVTHLKGTYDGGNIRLFVNGALKKTTPDNNGIKLTTSYIRVGFTEAGNWFDGLIDEILLLNRASDTLEAIAHSARRYP